MNLNCNGCGNVMTIKGGEIKIPKGSVEIRTNYCPMCVDDVDTKAVPYREYFTNNLGEDIGPTEGEEQFNDLAHLQKTCFQLYRDNMQMHGFMQNFQRLLGRLRRYTRVKNGHKTIKDVLNKEVPQEWEPPSNKPAHHNGASTLKIAK